LKASVHRPGLFSYPVFVTLFLCRAWARVIWYLGLTKTVKAAGPDYDALFYYAKWNPDHAEQLMEEWFPPVGYDGFDPYEER